GITDGVVTSGDLKNTYWRDQDGDGVGTSSSAITSCASEPPTGYASGSGPSDCVDDPDADSNAQYIYPEQNETCNGYDDNCDGITDGVVTSGDLKSSYFLDADSDNHGVPGSVVRACSAPSPDHRLGSEANADDCDDSDGDIHPGITEVCNGYDDNCDDITDGTVEDDDLKLLFYRDQDLDTYGTSATQARYCAGTQPSGWVPPPSDPANLDCDDSDATINRAAQEICNNVDDDCDGDADDADSSPQYPDRPVIEGTTFACSKGAWVITGCPTGKLHCDTNVNNGCERDGTTLSDCGACNNACMFSCGATDCSEVERLAAGFYHTCAVTSDGRLGCWGKNDFNQATPSTDDPVAQPTWFSALSDVTLVAAGTSHTCATFGSSNTIACWGSNASNQLGTGTSAASSPTPITILDSSSMPVTDAISLAAGRAHNCAAFESGEARCWGERNYGQVGNGSTSDGTVSIPALVRTAPSVYLEDIVEVAAGDSHSCARTNLGDVYCWGFNSAGQLGVGDTTPEKSGNALKVAISNVTMITAGKAHTCALSSGTVYCWGLNTSNQVGQASGDLYTTPQAYGAFSDAVAVAAGGTFTCARRPSAVACWGSNTSGERGDTAPASASATAVAVSGLSAAFLAAGGGGHACAIEDSGQAVCWGNNLSGQLGNGGSTNTHLPQDVSPLLVP
ncbi:MAG: hypothetical protein JW940_10415, partial [Polyangiaceae bacterium]|nr:hypothetical protein [Polyangiaceae bacterium]